MMGYTAANGQEITEKMVGRWCEAYERGEFPEGEKTVGGIVMGRPPLSSDKTVTIALKVPAGMKEAITRKAKHQGTTVSAYIRSALTEDILAASYRSTT